MSKPLIMSFRPDAAQMCLDGRKRRTRRSEVDSRIHLPGRHPAIYRRDKSGNVRVVWRVGDPVTIKASCTGRGLGRVLCTGLRVEHVQDITEEEARLEGVEPAFIGIDQEHRDYHRTAFTHVWRRRYPRGPKSWDANPHVLVIEFEPEVPR